MRIRAAMLVAVLVICCIPLPAFAGETPGSIEPTTPPTTSPEPPAAPPVSTLEESGPVGVWLSLTSGAGTDSRQQNSAEDVREVRWVFELKGAPLGTEFHVWATFADVGEVEAVGIDRAVVVTSAHDVLTDAYGHCIIPSTDLAVTVELAAVEVDPVPAPMPAAEPVSDEGSLPATASVTRTKPAEEFLPFTGPDDRLPILALLFAAVGLALRRYGVRPA